MMCFSTKCSLRHIIDFWADSYSDGNYKYDGDCRFLKTFEWCVGFFLALVFFLPYLFGRRSCVVGECEFPLWCGAKKHHAVLFLSGDIMGLPMTPRTKPFFTL